MTEVLEMNWMYEPGELMYADVAPMLHARGYSCIPQQFRDGKRMPALVDGRTLKFADYIDRRPTDEELEWWAVQNQAENAAILCGPASGDLGCIDIDVYDPKLSERIQDCATEVLGQSPFQRVGQAPKIALFYRFERVPGRNTLRWALANEDGNGPSDHAVELIFRGPVTAYGWHHKTGQYFQWASNQPIVYGPEAVPPISEQKLEEFKLAVSEIRPFHVNKPAKVIDFPTVANTSGLRVPRISSERKWIENADGVVVDGREAYLWELAWNTVKRNPTSATNAGVRSRVKQLVVDEFKRKTKLDGWPDSRLRREADNKVNRAVDMYAKNPRWFVPRQCLPIAERPGEPQIHLGRITITNTSSDPALAWLSSVRQPLNNAHQSAADPVEAAARALFPDDKRKVEQDNVSRFVKRSIRKKLFAIARLNSLRELVKTAADKTEKDRLEKQIADLSHELTLLKAPTGAGKTVAVLEQVEKVKRRLARVGKSIGPLLVFMPNYGNINEFTAKAEDLNARLAVSLDEKTVDETLEKASALGLVVHVYRGMERAGCQQVDKLRLVREAKLSAAGLCEAKVPVKDQRGDPINDDNGQKQYDFKKCEFFETCEYQLQKRKVAGSDIVLVPHAYLTVLGFPAALKVCTGVVIDERVWDGMIGSFKLTPDELFPPRALPKLTKAMRENGMDAETLLADRDECVSVVKRAVSSGQDIFEAFLAYKPFGGGRTVLELVAGWRYTVDHIRRDGTEITPDVSIERLQDLAKFGSATNLFEERRLALIVGERIWQVLADKNHGTKTAKGLTDHRVQVLDDQRIRVSWRREPNTLGMPTLMLDASASARIVSKLWQKHSVREEAIDTQSFLKIIWCPDASYARSQLVPTQKTAPETVEKMAVTLNNVRSAIANLCGVYGYSGVLGGFAKAYEELVLENWPAPDNFRTCRYGAMRGLDFAKGYAAAISVGRVEASVEDVDAIVGALTYDDNEPEMPVDTNGDGKARCPLRRRTVKMRDGSDVTILVPEYAGEWARLVQAQIREEELRQFVGRLRPVYRQGEAPVWLMLGTCMPEEFVVDEVITLQSLAEPTSKTGPMPNDFNAALAARVVAEGMTTVASLDVTEAGVTRFAKRIEASPLLRRAFSKLSYQVVGSDDWKTAWIPGYVRNPIAAVEEVAAAAGIRLAFDPEDIEECRRDDYDQRDDDPLFAKVGSIRQRTETVNRLYADLWQRAGSSWDVELMKMPVSDRPGARRGSADLRLSYEHLLRKASSADWTTESEPEMDEAA